MAIKTEVVFGNYINGHWKQEAAPPLASINPSDAEEVVGYVQNSPADVVDEGVEAAKGALLPWRKLTGAERGHYLYQAANQLESRLDEIAETLAREMGKTLPEAKGETARGVAILRYYAGEGLRADGEVIPSTDSEALMFTKRVPLGVVGVITPWNFPVAIPVWKIAPALIYGNTVVFKPATEAAVTAAKVVECFAQAGLPKGVLNFVTGSGKVIGNALVDHEHVHGLTFTGSEQTGKQIGKAAAARGAKYQLEMGGKNPVIVAEDADLHVAVDATISGAFRSTGQKCTATSRVIVAEAILQDFQELLLEKTKQITIGKALDDGVWMGPCASEAQLRTVLDYIEIGKKEGAKLLCGGKRVTDGNRAAGYFVEPTIFTNVNRHMRIAQEEIFGPVITLITAKNMEEAIEIANDSRYGLSASIFTTNIEKMLLFIDEMDAGLVRVNAESAGVELQAPFGGMKASSSHSREQGQAAKEFYTSIKTVFVKG
ncbi:aldehyde dehydrogenase family protein [Shouchella clausii]|uniref:alpha-ketoglutaric semialdehyde dehydrogenase GucD n=1 Tax=Shouchella TaxID=2893057 RepID=UPI0004E79BE0|nr:MULTISPECIES: alpha-ketoglutaric semialdehyde dehydrogenase GucD [Shouchella]MCM3313578.1 aldehyde dehydrogenase family protein [Psychrobacillus sp. MER TA 17]ALA54112.1 Ketoglutarate semialdehyde dehydrogenase [Shouchella clausii]MBU3229336.1 aldehyde dehydrogenase family protein [Shouchella clausii]MBU3265442.1 aldehyde dehydrogenase family protein [Shouchella clausii]MBU3506236.1 aldehyde dehydrogenase family protein [Shouchella clausii]